MKNGAFIMGLEGMINLFEKIYVSEPTLIYLDLGSGESLQLIMTLL